jgi:hypothetical protein
MPFVKSTRRLTLVVLAAYLAVNSLGTLLHERLHAHESAESCCHAHDGHPHSPAPDSAAPDLQASHAHDCVVCRVTGQPVVPSVAVAVELSAIVSPDSLPCPAAAPRSLAARLAQSRAPPVAAI